MGLKDFLVGSAINAAEDKLHGEAEEEKMTVGGGVLRFFVSLLWVLITLAVSALALYAMAAGAGATIFGFEDGKILCFVAIGLCLLITVLTFIIPYLRKKGSLTRWCGVVALGDAIWWIYIYFTDLV